MKVNQSFSLRSLLVLTAVVALVVGAIFLPASRLSAVIERLSNEGVQVIRLDDSSIATIVIGMRRYHLQIADSVSLHAQLSEIPHVESANFLRTGKPFAEMLSMMPELSRVEVGEASDEATKPLANLRNLVEVKISGEKFTGKNLAVLSKLPRLSTVDLSHSSVSNAALVDLSAIPSLEHLSLAHTKVTNQGIHKLRQLRLKSLDLDGTSISEEGICEIATLTGLEILSARCEALSDADFRCFAAGAIHESLQTLSVNVLHVDSFGKSSLHRALPGCKVYSQFTVAEPVFEETFDLSGLNMSRREGNSLVP